ncbi:MAG: hypothetical protein KDE19_01035 [Caldilineaceae bacterium]|nr:hypothetical protein [Caldilineaceae bacterium]
MFVFCLVGFTLFPHSLWAQSTPEIPTEPSLASTVGATAERLNGSAAGDTSTLTPESETTPLPATPVPPTAVVATSTSVPTVEATAVLDEAQLLRQQIDAQIDEFMQVMSPEERVGQLFVISFAGNDIADNSDISELIHQYHIGGVILAPARENYTNAKGVNTPEEVAILTNQLQALAYGYLLPADRALHLLPSPRITNAKTITETLAQTVTQSLVGLVKLAPVEPSDQAPDEAQGTGATTGTGTNRTEGATATVQAETQTQIPLLIGVEQLGDGYPTTALRRGFTTLPSQLALGSTWNPELVQAVGTIVGQELSAVGINLLLGPSLDVVDRPRTDPVGALGVHSFGGDPYWVSRMGSAYIRGLHEGSTDQLAAIARHFPGQGDIDRLPEQEVATVQQSLAELQQVALPPFTYVTRDISRVIAPTAAGDTVDGLMTSHMRFSAFQGATTSRVPPISFTPELQLALEQVNLAGWHQNGGILMTNALGTPAIRRYYQTAQQEIPYRVIALDAFAAGHDLIYLDQLSANRDWEVEKRYIKDVVQFFQQRYRNDSDFQAQIDVAVRRILRLKFSLYRNADNAYTPRSAGADASLANNATLGDPTHMLLPLSQVLVQSDDLSIFAEESAHRQQAAATIAQVARESITLLYPDLSNLSGNLPAPPQATDQLLIFSDSRLFHECATCTAETMLGPEELKSIIVRLYGTNPGATGQITPDRVYGRSFSELQTLLVAQRNAEELAQSASTAPITTVPLTGTSAISALLPLTAGVAIPALSVTPSPMLTPMSGEEADNSQQLVDKPLSATEHLQQLLEESTWIIFAMLDVDPTRNPNSDVVKEFLREESELLSNKQIIVLSLNVPYFLDATEISKLTAYIGVYSKTQPFLESAVRTLFRSYTPTGAPAVSVPGTRFANLSERLEADPTADLQLTIEVNGEVVDSSPESNTPVVTVGSVLRMHVDQILDHNGHLVPDGTPVEFHLVYENPEMTLAVDPVLTRRGSATTEVVLTQPGRLSISATVGDATTEMTRLLSIQDPAVETPTEAPATVTPEVAVAPLVTTTVTPTGTLISVSPTDNNGVPVLEPDNGQGVTGGRADWKALLIALFTIIVTLSLLLILQIHLISRSVLVKNMLWATIFGLGAYIFFALNLLPGMDYLTASFHQWSAAVVVFVGMLLPLLWIQLNGENVQRAK